MTMAMPRPRQIGLRAPRHAWRASHPGRARSVGLRPPRIRTSQLVMAVIFAMVALAVTLQAQRVTGQGAIEDLFVEMTDASRQTAELRARVAEAESPSEVLTAAESLGMVQPGAVVAVPATGAVDVAPGTVGAPVG